MRMNKFVFTGIIVFGLITMHGVAKSGDYILGTGDILQISVYGVGENDLSQGVIIRPDGKISFPLIDDVQAAGLTPKELDDVITEKLSHRIPNPEVTVSVTDFPSSEYQVYVLGEVDAPGMFPIHGEMTLLEAITLAGSPSKNAYLDRVHIVRGGLKKPTIMSVNLKYIIERGQVDKDIVLEPGDIVYVPEQFIVKVNTVIDRFLPMLRVVTLGAEFGDLLD
jgi:polysaccharide export outer membrane protein